MIDENWVLRVLSSANRLQLDGGYRDQTIRELRAVAQSLAFVVGKVGGSFLPVRHHRYAVPVKPSTSIFDGDPLASEGRVLEVDTTGVPVEVFIHDSICAYTRVHGSRPEGVVVGWRAFLTLCAQRGTFGVQEVAGVAIRVSTSCDPMEVEVLAPTNVDGLLRVLSVERMLDD